MEGNELCNFIRNCPICSGEMKYKTRKSYQTCKRKGTKCHKCASTRYEYQYNKDGKLYRICPSCGKPVIHKNKRSLYLALRKNSMCKPCSVKTTPRGWVKTPTWTGKFLSTEHKRKISESTMGRVDTKETKNRKRQAHIKRIQARHQQMYPNYNSEACKIIEEYGKQHGYNFQHAENGGEFHIKELGYWVDGYDKEKNVVIEYYEKQHQQPKHKTKDLQRQKEIINLLKCEFIILWYNKLLA